MNPDIFRAYDVRGLYPDDFDAVFAQRLGERVASHMKAGQLVVGRDARAGSDELAYAVIDGAVHSGANVIDVGVLSTPQFYWAIRARGAVGGVMVTASHNPEQYNGFKVVTNHGGLLHVVGGHAIRQVFDSNAGGHRSGGGIEHQNVSADYTAAVAYAAGWRGGQELRLSIDAPSSVRDVLARLGPVAPDADIAVRFDTDGDRAAFFEKGVQIPADYIFLLLAEQLHLHPLVLDLRFSRSVKRRLEARGVPFTVSKVGRLSMTEAMQRTHAMFGGELSGHYYWREFGGMECPELTALRCYEVVERSGKTLAELVAPYRVLFKSDEVSIPVRDRKHADSLLRALAEHFRYGTQDRLDGLTVDFDDWWFNIRPSNTEPVVRLVVEGATKQLLDSMVSEILMVIRPIGRTS